MFKDYVIIDDVLTKFQSQKLRWLSKNIGYYSNELNDYGLPIIDDAQKPSGEWVGFRSKPLHLIDNELFQSALVTTISKSFKIPNFNYIVESYLHLVPGDLEYKDHLWHVDHNYLFAGVVYLNDPNIDSAGTLLDIDNQIIDVENKFNRLLLYNANVLHRPANWHGKGINDMRLTLTIFIKKLEFTSTFIEIKQI